ncbi:hypothetical protein GF389_03490 [Candidatus Dojkabacteria bacterium]|nr:hypothetical protein [Candidatus Dojkabacteria bacterium]
MPIPQFIQPYLPSSDVSVLDPERDKNYILQGLLDSADLKSWKWMRQTYKDQDIKKVLENSRTLDEKDKRFWQVVLD